MNTLTFPIGMMARPIISEFKFAMEQQFDCVELSTNPGDVDNFVKNVGALVQWRKYFPIKIAALGYFGVEYQRDPREYTKLLQLMDICNILDIEVIHIGSGSRTANAETDTSRTIDLLGRALDEAKSRGLSLALYTCKVSNYAWDPVIWPQLFRSLPDLRLKYDPSHAFHSGRRNYLKEIQEWGSRLIHFHAKGGYILSDGTRGSTGEPPPGEDQIDWSRVLQTLAGIDYQGALVIELHSDRYSHKQYYEALCRSRDYLRKTEQALRPLQVIAPSLMS